MPIKPCTAALHSIKLLTLFVIGLCCPMACVTTTETPAFQGDKKAIALAQKMYEAIGGTSAWCNVKSLYVKAEHTQPDMESSYQSEIWRDLDKFDMVIEQQGKGFHVKAKIKGNGGSIQYLDERDTSRILTPEQIETWRHNNKHNVYVVLHKLSCQPEAYTVRIEPDEMLAFYSDTSLYAKFKLDEKLRPHQFYAPNPEGKVSGSQFTKWGNTNGLIHSAGGQPLDGSFAYTTEEWIPSDKPLQAAFAEDVK